MPACKRHFNPLQEMPNHPFALRPRADQRLNLVHHALGSNGSDPSRTGDVQEIADFLQILTQQFAITPLHLGYLGVVNSGPLLEVL